MGIETATKKDYCAAIRQLFPMGEYWENQFSDPESDISLFCKAKTNEIISLRKRMFDLIAESKSDTSVETIGDWERVLIGRTDVQLSLQERRNKLNVQKASLINRFIITDIAKNYGLKFIDLIFPFKASFFGFSKFGTSMFSRPAFFSFFYIVVEFQDDELINAAKECIVNLDTYSFKQSYPRCYEGCFFSGIKKVDDFEQAVNNRLIAGNIAYFQYKLENSNF